MCSSDSHSSGAVVRCSPTLGSRLLTLIQLLLMTSAMFVVDVLCGFAPPDAASKIQVF